MITGLSPAQEQFVASIDNLQTRLSDAQTQISSGSRINKPSDAPQAIGDIFQTRASLGQVTQIEQNLNLVKGQVDAGDTALQSAIQLLENAIVLGTQGANATTTQSQRNTLAAQVQGLLSQLVGLSQTQVNGVYIFGGDAAKTAPYKFDLNSPTGVQRLVVTQSTSQVADPTGLTFQVSKTAQDLFDKRDDSDGIAPENAFAALYNLQATLANGDQASISASLDALHTASDYLNQQLGFYGAAQNRIDSSLDLAKKFEIQGQTLLSSQQDTDVASVALQLTQINTDLNAAMAAQAKRPTTTLFDYLR